MRIKNEIVARGFFSLPEMPTIQIPGTLIIKEGGDITLEILGNFDNARSAIMKESDDPYSIPRIVGIVENIGDVTLDECFYNNHNDAIGGVAVSTLTVNLAISGKQLLTDDPLLFNDVYFSIEGLDDWVRKTGIKVEKDLTKRSATISYTPLQDIDIQLDCGFKLYITYTFSFPGAPVQDSATIKHKAYLKLGHKEAQPLDTFINLIFKIISFLGFAIDKNVCLEDVIGYRKNDSLKNDKKEYLQRHTIYYPSRPYVKIPEKIYRNQMLFNYLDVENNFKEIINKWILAYDSIGPSLNLYFSSKTKQHKYLESNFLALAQCLETYHRRTSNDTQMDERDFKELTSTLISDCPEPHKKWLEGKLKYGNEITLGHRIKRIIKEYKSVFGYSKDQIKNMCFSIVSTRNYLTHYDPANEQHAKTELDLYRLCLQMEAIFQIHLLSTLNFSNEEIASIIKNNLFLKNKIDGII